MHHPNYLDGLLRHAMVHLEFCGRGLGIVVFGLFVGQPTLQRLVRSHRSRKRRNVSHCSPIVGDNGSAQAAAQILIGILVLPFSILFALWVAFGLHGRAIFHGLSISIHG